MALPLIYGSSHSSARLTSLSCKLRKSLFPNHFGNHCYTYEKENALLDNQYHLHLQKSEQIFYKNSFLWLSSKSEKDFILSDSFRSYAPFWATHWAELP